MIEQFETLPDVAGKSALQVLASAYAERLSCLRCGASEEELRRNADLIAELERRVREEDLAPVVALHPR